MSKEGRTVGGGFSTFYPAFRDLFPEILRVLIAHGSAYTPDRVGGQALGRTVPFRQDQLDELFKKWKAEDHRHPFWIFEKRRPSGLVFLIGDTLVQYRTIIVQVDRDYLVEDGRTEEFLKLLKELYDLIHPMYGEISIPEMIKKIDSPLGKVTPGTDLERGLPDIFWANFLGPEYVEMFGADKVLSAPCHSVERLRDGGTLLLLSPSPLDYLVNPEDLDKQRLDIKKHLGIEAFDIGDASYHGKIPKFRYEEQWKAEQAMYFAAPRRSQDILSRVQRNEWKDWIENNEAIALAFVSEMKYGGLTLDLSKESLRKLDGYIENSSWKKEQPSLDLIKKLGAYLTQVIIRQNGAKWSFQESDELPSLNLEGGVQVIPLARVLKTLEEGEKFGFWYERVNEVATRLNRGKHFSH